MILTLFGGEGDLLTACASAVRFALYAFVLFASGMALFHAAYGHLQAADATRKDRQLVLRLSAGGIATAWVWLAVQVGVLSGGSSLDAEIWAVALATGPGYSVLVASLGFVVLGTATALNRLSISLAIIASVLLAVSFTFVGHTVRTQPRALLAILLIVHLLGAAFWAGSLVPLARSSREGGMAAARLVEAWTRAASWIVPALVLAGLLLAWLIVGRLDVLLTTTYGRTLIVKVLLVGVLLAFAAWHRFWLTPGLLADRPNAGRRLSRSILLEVVVMVAVLWTVSELTSTSPS